MRLVLFHCEGHYAPLKSLETKPGSKPTSKTIQQNKCQNFEIKGSSFYFAKYDFFKLTKILGPFGVIYTVLYYRI